MIYTPNWSRKVKIPPLLLGEIFSVRLLTFCYLVADKLLPAGSLNAYHNRLLGAGILYLNWHGISFALVPFLAKIRSLALRL